jgi:hypothetical protein
MVSFRLAKKRKVSLRVSASNSYSAINRRLLAVEKSRCATHLPQKQIAVTSDYYRWISVGGEALIAEPLEHSAALE